MGVDVNGGSQTPVVGTTIFCLNEMVAWAVRNACHGAKLRGNEFAAGLLYGAVDVLIRITDDPKLILRLMDAEISKGVENENSER